MRTLNEMVLADLIAARAEARPDLDVVTFEGGETGPDEVRTYAAALDQRQPPRGRADRARHELRRPLRDPDAQPPRVRRADDRRVADRPGLRADRSAHARRQARLHAEQLRLSRGRLRRLCRWPRSTRSAARFHPRMDLGARKRRRGRRAGRPRRRRRGRALAESSTGRRLRSTCGCDDPNDPLQIIYTSGTTGDPKGVVFANARFGGASMLTAMLGYRRRRAALHRALAHPRQRPADDAGLGAARWASGPCSAASSPSRACGTSRASTAAPSSISSAAWRPRSTASRSSPTTPTTRCASSSAPACRRRSGRLRAALRRSRSSRSTARSRAAWRSSRSAPARSAASASRRPASTCGSSTRPATSARRASRAN